MNFNRRVLMVLGTAGAAGGIFKIRDKSEPSTQQGGWSSLNLSTGLTVDRTGSQN